VSRWTVREKRIGAGVLEEEIHEFSVALFCCGLHRARPPVLPETPIWGDLLSTPESLRSSLYRFEYIGQFQNLRRKTEDHYLVIFFAATNATAAPDTNINAPPTTRL
jgi:hypothetical protein